MPIKNKKPPLQVGHVATLGSRLSPKDVPTVNQAFNEIEDRRGIITAEILVEEAKLKKSPLHKFFTWDDTSAAHSYRLEQARHLIRSIRAIVITEEGKQVTVPVRVIVDSEQGRHYRSTIELMNDAEARAKLVEQALKEAKAWRARYLAFTELAKIVMAIDETLKQYGK